MSKKRKKLVVWIGVSRQGKPDDMNYLTRRSCFLHGRGQPGHLMPVKFVEAPKKRKFKPKPEIIYD